MALPVGSLAFTLGPTASMGGAGHKVPCWSLPRTLGQMASMGGAGPPVPSSCPSCLRGEESRSRGSRWAYPMGLSRTGKVSLVASAIFHHEDTKGTKKGLK